MNFSDTTSIDLLINLHDELSRLKEAKMDAEKRRGKGFQETMDLVSLDSMTRQTESKINSVNDQAVRELELLINRAAGTNSGGYTHTVNGREYSATLLANKTILITYK